MLFRHSLDDLLNILKKDYESDLSTNKYTVNKIELSYLPCKGENQTIVLKPVWMVYIKSVEENVSEHNLKTVVDAASGNIMR